MLLTLFERVVCERELKTEQNCNILTPHSYCYNSVSFPVLLGCLTRGLGAQPLWDMVLIPASSLQLLNQGSWGPPLLDAGSLYHILSPTDLNFLSPGLYNNLTPPLLPASVTISHSIQPLESQGRPWYLEPDAPVIYTGAFPILTAWPGRRSICNTLT